MTRAWLILADILVTLALLGALILFYLFSAQTPKTSPLSPSFEQNNTYEWDENALDEDLRAVVALEDWMELRQGDGMDIYEPENKWLAVSLEQRLADLGATIGDPVFVRIFKQESLLEVWIRSEEGYAHLKDYAICAYSGRLGPKLAEGDMQSPEGFYKVKNHQLNPNSKFHLAFNLGYPNRYDRAYGRSGSLLMVHGNCVSVGCYAMGDAKIQEIYALVEGALQNEQKYVWVHIFPFRLTQENLARYADDIWHDFWVNLKEGYDYFEAETLPPHITVKNKRYIISESKDLL